MLWNVAHLKPVVLLQAQDAVEAIYGMYIVQDQFVQEKELSGLQTSNMNFWIFFTEMRESDAKRSFQGRHEGSWKSLEDLRFWKLMNELSISTYADFM